MTLKWTNLTLTGKAYRLASIASLAGVIWALHGFATADEMEPIVYLFFWLPVWCGIVTTLWLASGWCVQKDRDAAARSEVRLNRFVHALFIIGIIAMLGEGIIIARESKQAQGAMLVVLCCALALLRWWIHSWTPKNRQRINAISIAGIVMLGAGWWTVLGLALRIFDRG